MIIGLFLVALIIGGVTYVNYDNKNKKNEAAEIEKSIMEHDYRKVSNLLKNSDINKIQPYTEYNLTLMKTELDQAIKYQDLITNKNYKQFILEYEPDRLKDEHLYEYTKGSYAKALREFFTTSDYKEKLEMADKVNFEVFQPDFSLSETKIKSLSDTELENIIKHQLKTARQIEDEINGEISIAKCTEYFYNREIDSCVSLMQENNTSDKTDEVLKLALAMQNEHKTGQDKEFSLYIIAGLEISNELPSPFKEEFEKLLNKYKDTEEYRYAKSLHSIDYDEPIIKRPKIGMTPDEVREIWGNPKDINRTETAYGISEQWVYVGYRYVYFEDGFVTAIQD